MCNGGITTTTDTDKLEGWDAREFIDNYFAGTTGKFLEIGAFKPFDYSLTAGLAANGWEGLRVEPNPEWFMELLNAKEKAPNVNLLLGAVELNGQVRRFWHDRRAGGSTIVENWMHAFEHLAIYCDYFIRTIPLCEVLELVGLCGLRYVMIDAEGVDMELVEALPLSDMRDTELISVEWNEVAEIPGYRLVCKAECNTIWERIR